jgi:sugar lactone lactonase YvrE
LLTDLTPSQIIWAYDFDSATGTISNRRIFIDRRGQDGEPDGLVLDTAGNVYTFLWKGSHVVKYDCHGTLVRDWKINASRVTHGAWVGKNFDELVITSAEADEGSTPWEGEEGGALFWIKDLGCAGMRKHKFGKAG